MGDRAMVVFTDGSDVSPTVYLHWDGYQVGALLDAAVPRMRNGDVSYSCARFIGVCHEAIEGNCSLGVDSSPNDIESIISGGYSCGEAGVFVVNVETWLVTAYDGYGFGPDQPPTRQLEIPGD